MRYRRDIDGLRAVAIVPVVLYHAGLKLFGGGFVGVDVFFVISGFLITSLVGEEIAGGRFSIVQFYERRARRILPALFIVIAFASVAACWLLMPKQFDDFAQSVVATDIFGSNMLYWQQAGYFAAPAVDSPLLHTWSLAVEEQFYILFPPLLLLIHRWLKGPWIVWLAPIALASFAASAWGAHHLPDATFYLAPTRAWELLLGSLLALGAFPPLKPRWGRELLGVAGLALIGWAIFTFTRETPFPGVNALFPAVGATLVIWACGQGETATGRLLSAAPLVFIGLISYSLYLWHWPLLVLAQYWKVYELTLADRALLIALSFVAATASWFFVEGPVRRAKAVLTGPRLAGGVAFLMIGFAAFGLYGHFSHGWPARFPARVLQIAAYANSKDPRRPVCLASPERPIPPRDACVYGAATTPTYAVWGDSHASALIDMVGRTAARHGAAVRFIGDSGCPSIAGVGRTGDYRDCFAHNQAALDYLLRTPDLRTVILITRWSAYVEGFNEDFGPAERLDGDLPLITDRTGAQMSVAQAKALFAGGVSSTVRQLQAAGKTVVVVYPIPETGYDIPRTLAQLVIAGRDPATLTRPKSYYLNRQKFVTETLDSLDLSHLLRIRPDRLLCGASACIVYDGVHPLYQDDDHLSLAGADYISSAFEPVFAASPAPSPAGQPPPRAASGR